MFTKNSSFISQLRVILAILLMTTLLQASQEVPTQEEVAKLYVATFNRAPDSTGLSYWTNSSLMLSEIAQSFFDQEETQLLYPQNTSNADFIVSVYKNLFNREPDNTGLTYWEEQLDTNVFSKNSFIEAVINGALNTATSNDADILTNKTTVGLSFAQAGLDSVEDAQLIMADITGDIQSVTTALAQMNITKVDTVFTLQSSLVTDGGALSITYTCDGDGVSPPISWSNAPQATVSYALLMDHEVASDDFHWYWVLYNIDAQTSSLAVDESGIGTFGTNSVNDLTQYSPPCSKGPGEKAYTFTLYALSQTLNLADPSLIDRDALLEAIKGITLDSTAMTLTYERY